MKHKIVLAALLCGGASVATAGGYTAPVVETAPVVAVADASADWTGFYVGAQVGGADLEFSPPGLDAYFGTEGRHYGIHAGYLRDYGQFVSGIELSYDKLDGFDEGFFLPSNADGDLIRAKLLAGYDAGRFLPYAAVSFARLTVDGLGVDSVDDTGFGFGLGAKFMATPRVMLGVEWMTNEFDFDEMGDSFDVDLNTFTVSASYRF